MTEQKEVENAASMFGDKLPYLSSALKNSAVAIAGRRLQIAELARADVKAMSKVYDSGPK
jgi:hypothetical protein